MTETIVTDSEFDPSIVNYYKLNSEHTVNTSVRTPDADETSEESDLSDFKSYDSKPPSILSSSSSCCDLDQIDDWTIARYRADCLSLASDWGCPQCFQPPFSYWDDKIMDVKVRSYEDIELNDMENEGVLTDRIIAACSSLLRQSPETGRFTYTKCVLQSKNLSDIRILHYHNYLQYLDLSFNKLKSISALDGLPFLMYLDVSNNYLRKLLDFKQAPINLQYVNYANNLLDEIPDLSRFWTLIRLNLAHNKIARITGLFGLRYLTHLNLSHNRLKTIENLSRLPLIKLNLSSNRISQFTSCLEGLKHVTHIDVSYNRLKSLILFQNIENLINLNVSHNSINHVLDLTYLQNLRYLSELNLSLNPICENNHYKVACLYSCKRLIRLDDEQLSSEELLEVRSKFEDNPQFSALIQRLLVLLNNVNQPNPTALDMFSMEFKPLPVIILVGLPGSNRGPLLNTFCTKYEKYCVRGVSHTTRPQMHLEENGIDYYFVNRSQYTDMLKDGQFLTHFEFNGNYYGFSRSELNKATDKVLLIHMDISSALTLRLSHIKPILVLALPSSEQEHLSAVIQKYTFTNYSSICDKFVRDAETIREKHARKLCEKALLDPIHGELDVCCCAKICKQSDNGAPISCVDLKNINSTIKCLNADDKDEKLNVSFKEQSEHLENSDSVLLEDDDEVLETRRVGNSISEEIFAFGNPDVILSVLSTSELFSQKDPSYCLENEGHLNPVVNDILKQRNLLLQLHMSAPGLFTAMVFTDQTRNTVKKLKAIVKTIVENTHLRQPVIDLKCDISFHNIIRNRIERYMTELQKDYKGESVFLKHCDVCLNLNSGGCKGK